MDVFRVTYSSLSNVLSPKDGCQLPLLRFAGFKALKRTVDLHSGTGPGERTSPARIVATTFVLQP